MDVQGQVRHRQRKNGQNEHVRSWNGSAEPASYEMPLHSRLWGSSRVSGPLSADPTLKAPGAWKAGNEVAQGGGLKPWLHLQTRPGAFKAATSGPTLVIRI